MLEKIKLPAQENVSSPVSGGVAGAAAALKRLESTELQAFERMQAALTRGNPLEIREARESWLKVSESLRKYDLMIEANRRDAGELVPVTEIDKFIRSFVSYMQVVLTYRAESLVNEIMGKDEMAMYRALRDLFNKMLFHGVLGNIRGGGKTKPDPRLVEYARKCLDEQCGWWAKHGGWADNQEKNLVALIKWAEEPMTEEPMTDDQVKALLRQNILSSSRRILTESRRHAVREMVQGTSQTIAAVRRADAGVERRERRENEGRGLNPKGRLIT